VRRADDGRIVRSARDVRPADRLDVRLGEGRLAARVESIEPDPA
jgi:ribosomal 50S subunit-recycling heat shock protein